MAGMLAGIGGAAAPWMFLLAWRGDADHGARDILIWFMLLPPCAVLLVQPHVLHVTLGSRWGFRERLEADDPGRYAPRGAMAGFALGLVAIGLMLR